MANFKMNGVNYNIEDGFIIKDAYTEVLDTAVITIPLSNPLNLEPFDYCELQDDRFGTKYYSIDTWVDEIASFEPLKYTYTINLISETLKLQRVVLPNLSITQPIGATPKTIYDEIKRIYDLYIVKQYPELTLSENIENLTDVCAERMFSRPTAYEFINDCLSKINAIVTIKRNVIDIIKLDRYGNPIDTSLISFENSTQNAKEYADRLDIQVDNAISDNTNYHSLKGISLRGNENDAIMNDDNMVLILDKPIYEITKVEVIYQYYNSSQTILTHVLDITDRVVEKSIYDTYKSSASSGFISTLGYKRNALYYSQGSNKIEGFSFSEKAWLITRTAIENIIKAVEGDITFFNETGDFRDSLLFNVEYKTNDSYRFNAIKNKNHRSTLIDNQSEKQVDSEDIGNTELNKLNRLGNKARIINATYYTNETIPELSDYIDDYILSEREIVYYNDYALFKGYLYKDFVKKNMFYGLDSKKRFTQISGDYVERNDIINYRCYFDNNNESTGKIARFLLMPISFNETSSTGSYLSRPEKIKGIIFFKDKNNNNIYVSDTNDKYLLMTPSIYQSGKSGIIQFSMKDNLTAGMYLGTSATGGREQKLSKYCDNYGEFETIDMELFTNDFGDLLYDFATLYEGGHVVETPRQCSNKLPVISDRRANSIISADNIKYVIGGQSKIIKKDNREKVALTISYTFDDSENVIIGNFASQTPFAASQRKATNHYVIFYSTDEEYQRDDRFGKGQIAENVVIDNRFINDWVDYGTSFNVLKLNLNGTDTSNWKSWGICKSDGSDLLIGVNKGTQTSIPTTLWLHIEKMDY